MHLLCVFYSHTRRQSVFEPVNKALTTKIFMGSQWPRRFCLFVWYRVRIRFGKEIGDD